MSDNRETKKWENERKGQKKQDKTKEGVINTNVKGINQVVFFLYDMGKESNDMRNI